VKTIAWVTVFGLLAVVGCKQQQETSTPETTQEQTATETHDQGATMKDTMAAPSGIPTVAGDTITTESGLKYIVEKEGDGATPTMGQMVTVHYTGWLMDGTKFDSSFDRGRPAQFPVGRLIQGWNEALMGMKVGERRLLIIPPELGYGRAGSPPRIPPNATLVFDMELLGVAAAPSPGK
jgi:peptidylprolyl isomerase